MAAVTVSRGCTAVARGVVVAAGAAGAVGVAGAVRAGRAVGVVGVAGAVGAMVATLGALLTPTPALAQTFQGRVVEEGTDAPVPTTLVRLLDEEGDPLGISIADPDGAYRLEAPEPGVYRLEAERSGYETFHTPLLEAGAADGTYPIDLVMRADPYELPGFTVETNRVTDEEADREIRLMLGVSVASLRFRPIGFEEIQDHVDKGHSLVDVMRWTNNAGLIVSRRLDGPCFSVRGRGCLPVYLNGLPLHRDFVEAAPLDMVYRIVIVTPTDPVMPYGGGAVLLYTEAWLR